MVARLYSIVAIIAAICMASVVVLTVSDAIGRYFFNAPIAGAIEYISYFLAFLIMAGYALVTYDRGHISVGVLAETLPPWYGRIESIVTAVLTVVGCGFFAWFILEKAMSYASKGTTGETTEIPLAPLAYGLSLLAGTGLVFSVLLMLRVRNADHVDERTPT